MSIEILIACAAVGDTLPSDISLPTALVSKHGLGPLAFRLGAVEFEREAIASSLIFEHQERAAREVIDAIAAAGIPVMAIKGMCSARRHFREPGDRPMTDVDLLVAADAHREAALAVRRCGFWNAGDPRERGRFHHALTMKRPGAAIDLHRSIVQPLRHGAVLEGLWQRAEAGPPSLGAALQPDRVDEALMTLAHIARHELAVRALSYVDAARMLAAIDRGELEARARRARLWRGVRAAIHITDALSGGRGETTSRGVLADILARRDPGRARQVARKLSLLEGPLEAARLGLGAALEALGF